MRTHISTVISYPRIHRQCVYLLFAMSLAAATLNAQVWRAVGYPHENGLTVGALTASDSTIMLLRSDYTVLYSRNNGVDWLSTSPVPVSLNGERVDVHSLAGTLYAVVNDRLFKYIGDAWQRVEGYPDMLRNDVHFSAVVGENELIVASAGVTARYHAGNNEWTTWYPSSRTARLRCFNATSAYHVYGLNDGTIVRCAIENELYDTVGVLDGEVRSVVYTAGYVFALTQTKVTALGWDERPLVAHNVSADTRQLATDGVTTILASDFGVFINRYPESYWQAYVTGLVNSDVASVAVNQRGFVALDRDGRLYRSDLTLDVSEKTDSSRLVFYPNPCDGELVIEGGRFQQLTNVHGTSVVCPNTNDEHGSTLDVSGLPAGVYLLTVNGHDRPRTIKITIVK